ncbi:4'-phosphopantetheinyl transferase family protein [Azospirillum sp.]|uniref:4'-phosphopantetheinyl transferase family protein n=1 Tax=Azospirillum sp. TaxID=34012 RepID=UPI003D720357
MLALPPGTVHVWVRPVPPGPEDEGLALLDQGETARWHRFHRAETRRLFAAAHALLRTALSQYAAVDPRDWRFAAEAHGRPYLTGPETGLTFNLTHADGLAACAIARGLTVGIDAERTDRRLDLDGMARVAFAESERAQVAAAPPERKNAVFFGVWTLKEAYIKARGLGLALPLKSFSVTVEAPAITPSPDDPQAWDATLTRPTAEHLLALAVPRGAAVEWRGEG